MSIVEMFVINSIFIYPKKHIMDKYGFFYSIFFLWVFRVAFCYLMVLKFHCGLLFIWMGMFLDWAMRSLFFCVRFVRGRWMEQKVI